MKPSCDVTVTFVAAEPPWVALRKVDAAPTENEDGTDAVLWNVALTVPLADIEIVHCFELPDTGAQLELNPTNSESGSAKAVRVTVVPLSNSRMVLEQVGPQEMPVGFEVTVPVPCPVFATVSTFVAVKVAVTVLAAVSVVRHWVGMLVTGVQLELKPANL